MTIDTLPGYQQGNNGGVEVAARYSRSGYFRATRIDGPFTVRGSNFVQHINDGWLLQDPEGNLLGIEDAVFLDQYEVLTHTITATAGANGGISPSGAVPAADGDDVQFIITPNALYEIDELTVDGVPAAATVGPPPFDYSYNFDEVTEDHTIDVTFVLIG